MMATTTSNSISVKPFRAFVEMWDKCQAFKELKGFAFIAFGDLQVLRGEEDPVNVNRRYLRANSPPLLSH